MIPFIFDRVRPSVLKEMGLTGVKWGRCRIMVVVGDNASGKSLLRRLFQTFLQKDDDKTEIIHLSQQGRSSASIFRSMIYGSEDDEATSVISARTLVKGLDTSRNRKNKHFMIYDEPEIGMSEETILGATNWLRKQLENWPTNMRGFIVCTHSRQMATSLMSLPYSKFIWIHHPKATLQDWLNREIKPISPQKLIDTGLANWRKFSKLFKK